jgi:membrane protein YdbS with pleckstrin-like domain
VIKTNQKQESNEERILTDNIPDHLHPNVKKYWLITNVIAISFLILFMASPFIMGAAFYGGVLWVAVITIATVVMICLSAVLAMVMVNLVYENITFLVKDDSLTINKGMVFKHSITVPFNRVQNVTIFRGPLERIFGLSTITISTAGWGNGRLQGINHPELLRDIILKRVSKVKNNGL